MIKHNVSKKEAVKRIATNMQMAYYLTNKIYNKESTSINTKLWYYLTAESLAISKNN